ncbi:MAG: NuoM family protein [Pirellulaceae bacterium]
MSTLLIATIFLPLMGAILMWVLAPLGRGIVRASALMITFITLLAAGVLIANFPSDPTAHADYATTTLYSLEGVTQLDIRFCVALDGLGLWLFGLSALLVFSSVLVSWNVIRERAELFYAMLLLLEFGCLGVFVAQDIILFYVFFEFTLIPLFFLIGIWGSEERRYAAMKFFLFTLTGSLLTFLGLLAIVLMDYHQTGEQVMRFSIPELTRSLAENPIDGTYQWVIFWALFIGFAVKVPLFPLHTWLPLAHVQAPTAGSVILAGVLLKIGTYGFVRFSLPMLPEATVAAMPVVLWLSVIGILYGALVALAQSDIKRLIAYSSVSHLGFCMLGLFALNRVGLQGGTLQMVNHGLSTGALFALVGMIYERYHTREIRHLGGLARRLPWLAFFMLLFTLSSIGLPGLNGFVGEFMVLLAAFQAAWTESAGFLQYHLKWVAVLAVFGVVLGAWYMLWLYQRIFFGPVREPGHVTPASDSPHEEVKDLNWREIGALAPLAFFVVWIGLQPAFFLDRMAPTLDPVTDVVQHALEARPGMAVGPEATSTETLARVR